MFNRLLPKQANNNYSGHSIDKWAFIVIIIATTGRSLIHMFMHDSGAQSIATIPINTFTGNAAASVVLIFALWGSSEILMDIVYIVVAWRYRALIPFMYLLIFMEYVLRMLLMYTKPIHIIGTAPGHAGNYVMISVAFVMLLLSLLSYKDDKA